MKLPSTLTPPPPPPPLCHVVPMFELLVENNKQPNLEWRGGEGCFVLRSYPILGQYLNSFCRRLELLTEQFFISVFDSSSHSQCGALISKTMKHSFSKNSTHYSYFPGEDIAVMFLYRFNAATCKKMNITVWVIVGWYQLILKKPENKTNWVNAP